MRFYKTLALMAISLLLLTPYMSPVVKEPQNNKVIYDVHINSNSSFKTPDWVKHTIFYQIFPDRFRDGNPDNNAIGDGYSGDILYKDWYHRKYNVYAKSKFWGETPEGGWDWFGGDLQGVQEKAPYLADLGITAIWFNPTMDSTDNHGYHVIDYKSVSRYFGAHERGPSDELILNYTASLEVFKNMTAALDEHGIKIVLDGVFNHCSAKNKWFDRDNDYPTDGAYENQSSPWYDWFLFYSWPNDYYCWWGVKDIPNVQETEGFKDYVYRANDSVIRFWDDLGVDGWRLDCGGEVSDEFWQEFRTYYKQLNPEGFIVGELWGNASHWLQGDQWDSVMNYRFRGAVLDWANGGIVSSFNDALLSIKNDYPEEAFYAMFNILGSHDIERALTTLGEDKSKMKLAVIFQMTYPGAPVIYYGDEVGITGWGDPNCRQSYPWADLGFSPDLNLFNHYKKLIAIRKGHPVLSVGTLETKLVDDVKKIYVLERRYNSSTAILVYNNGDSVQTVNIDVSHLLPDGSILTDVLNNETYTVSEGKVSVQTRGMWANILISPSVYSCDSAGSSKDGFQAEDYVWCKGSGFPADTSVRLYVVENRTWVDGDNITDVRGPFGYNMTTTDANGNFLITCLGLAGNLSATEWPAYYDIVVDVNCDGIFDAGLDAVDDVIYLPGIIVPEAILLRDIAIVFVTCLIAIVITRRRDINPKVKVR